MADTKNNGPAPGRKQPQPAAETTKAAPAEPAEQAGSDPGDEAALKSRKRRYLCAVRPQAGLAPMAADMLHNYLNEHLAKMDGVEVVRRLKPSGFGALSAGLGGTGTGAPEIIVAEMDTERGEALRRQAASNSNFVVEIDFLLTHHAADPAQNTGGDTASDGLALGASVDVTLKIVGQNSTPLGGATVYVYGVMFPAQGATDANGMVQLTVYGGPLQSIKAIYVKPAADYWEQFVLRPEFNSSGTTIVQLRPLSETYPDFPNAGAVGWGQRLMQLDRIPANFTGRGVKVAIIDSGCDNAHPQLTHVKNGYDFTADPGSDTGWTKDEISHGTHCAGIITGASATVQGIRGFAPEAEVHAFKVFPGGRFSNLIDALDQCIEREIDVVNMSLGSDQPSELVARKIQEALEHGVALIVAAGNSGGPVQFPGNLPNVLTVSAVDRLNQFPADTNHAQTVLPGGVGDVFPAKFSCFGREVEVCGPGVAIVSCVPGGGYAAWDGTSMATPHITGLAALVLAHHPAFQGRPKQRNLQRAAQLLQILQAAARPCVVDVRRGGAGLPDAVAIFGEAGQAGAGAAVPPLRPLPPAPAQQPPAPIALSGGAPSAGPGLGLGGTLGGQPGGLDAGAIYGGLYPGGYFAPPQQAGMPGMLDASVIQALALIQMRAAGLI
jgi:subtilisin